MTVEKNIISGLRGNSLIADVQYEFIVIFILPTI